MTDSIDLNKGEEKESDEKQRNQLILINKQLLAQNYINEETLSHSHQ